MLPHNIYSGGRSGEWAGAPVDWSLLRLLQTESRCRPQRRSNMREDNAGVTNIQRNERTGYYEMCRRIPIGQHISGIIVVRAAHQRRHPVARDRQAQRTSTTEKKVLASAPSAESTKLNWGLAILLATPLAAKTSEPETGQETSKTQVKLLLLTQNFFCLYSPN